MGGGGRSTSSKTVTNITNEDIKNVHNNVKDINNYYNEHNILTDVQVGDRAYGGKIQIQNDVNAGTAYYGLQNLNFFGDLSTGLGAVSDLGG